MNYTYPQNRYMNRAERRKNGIKLEKKTYKKCNYTAEEMERIIRKELNDLINEPYSETIKKERYRRLQPLIEEYNKQKENLKVQVKPNVSHAGKETDRMIAYNRQKQALPRNKAYQTLNNSSNRVAQNSSNVQSRTRQAVAAYQEQANYVSNRAPQAKMVKKAEKVEKKGFFRRILDAFKPEPVVPKPTIRKPEPAKIQQTYHRVTQKVQQIKQVSDDIYNEFERQLRNFQNYSQNTIGYQYYKNGRQVKYEPRCL